MLCSCQYLQILCYWLLFVIGVVNGYLSDADINLKPDKTSAIIEPTPSTIIDILSSQVQYSEFLKVLQRNGLVPEINELRNVTLLAPVNLAFTDHQLIEIGHDELYRYIINQRFTVGHMSKVPTIFNTLYKQNVSGKSYPVLISPNLETLQYEVDNIASIVEADTYAKHQWSYIQAIDGQLPIKPSLCHVLLDDNDWSINGHNISFIKRMFKLLFDHQSSINTAKKHKKYKNIPTDCQEYLGNISSLFIPTDDLIQSSMPELSRRYYSALYDTMGGGKFTITDKAVLEIKSDITGLLNNLLISDIVGAANVSNLPYKTKNGQKSYLVISSKDDDTLIIVNDKLTSSSNGSNLVYGDGVIHLFDQHHNNVNFFEGLNIVIVEMNPRKALFALHYSSFVSELEFRSLDYLIDGSTENQTILLSQHQRDDMIRNDFLIQGTMVDQSFNAKQLLLYQFIDASVNITHEISRGPNSTFYRLFDSFMCSKSKINGCYKLKLSSSFNTKKRAIESRINDEVKIISEPFDMGNNSVGYFVNKPLTAPRSFKHTLADLLSNGKLQRHLQNVEINQQECLKTIQYLTRFNLLNLNDNKHGYSIFLPCGIPDNLHLRWGHSEGTWQALGLILNYLEAHPATFKDIMKGLFVDNMVYSDFGIYNDVQSMEAKTLRGDSVNITNVSFDGTYNHLLQINNSIIPLPLNSDLLFNQGVVHIIGKLLLPTDFEVSFLDLIETTKNTKELLSFFDLFDEFPDLKHTLSLESGKLDFSLLIPTQESLNTYNITKHAKDLLSLLQVHLIPNQEIPKFFDCMHSKFNSSEYSINSNSSKLSFRCKKSRSGLVVLTINNSDGEETRHKVSILNHGCARSKDSFDNNPCVFVIDQPIRPTWLEANDGFLHVHLGIISIGIGIILGLIIFLILIVLMIFYLGRKNEGLTDNDRSNLNNATSNFIRLGIGENVNGSNNMNYNDGGYETDDDMDNETDRLLPTGDQRLRRGPPRANDYGSTAPLTIKGPTKALNRSRNLPEV